MDETNFIRLLACVAMSLTAFATPSLLLDKTISKTNFFGRKVVLSKASVVVLSGNQV